MIYGGRIKCREVPLYLKRLYHTIIHVTTQLVAVRVSGFMSSNLISLCSAGVKFLK